MDPGTEEGGFRAHAGLISDYAWLIYTPKDIIMTSQRMGKVSHYSLMYISAITKRVIGQHILKTNSKKTRVYIHHWLVNC